ncbi:MAG: outer rane beta-barrel protein [Rhodospirillales bacterium]|nr:outer rane beta-barrel protein [Rhodospirillales bacterium]
MVKTNLIATTALGVALLASVGQAQQMIPDLRVPIPPVAPTDVTQRPEQFGQFLQRGQSVLDRPRPEYDALGLRYGSFFLYPRITADEVFNDNIFATKNNTRNDFITVISPTLNLRSNWSNHQLNFDTGASVGTYARSTTENYGDYFVGSDGRYDFSRNLAGLAAAKYEHLHEERDSVDAPTTSRHPIEFDAYTARFGITQHDLRIGYIAGIDFRREDYQNGAFPSGVPIIESVRNLNVYSPNAQLNYEIAPRYQAFIRANGDFRRYDHFDPGVGAKRDSNGFRADVGGRFDLTGVTYVEAAIGYLTQQYQAATLTSIRGVDASAKVVWNVTQITSISANALRTAQDANTAALATNGNPVNSPGYLKSVVGVAIDHELLRNVILHGEANYENDDYMGFDRTDDRIDVGAGARYMFTRNLFLGGAFTYTNRSSGGRFATGQFNRDLLMLRLGAQL